MRLSFADGLFWTSVACCAIAQLLIVRSVLRLRPAPPEAAATLPRQRSAVELFWTVVPAVALVALLIFTRRAMHDAAAGAMPAPASATSAR